MQDFAANLHSTGQLRGDLDRKQIADILWSMNAPEYWGLLVQDRGSRPDQFRLWIADAWKRTLLKDLVAPMRMLCSSC